MTYTFIFAFLLTSVKLSTPLSKRFGEESCSIEPHPTIPRNYLIHVINEKTNEKVLFGQVCYELCSYDNYLYTIIIGRKLYKVRSCDLKDRRLAIIDTFDSNNYSQTNSYTPIQCPETLFQVIDSFSKANKSYHVTINDREKQIGYLGIIILLSLHECKRAESKD